MDSRETQAHDASGQPAPPDGQAGLPEDAADSTAVERAGWRRVAIVGIAAVLCAVLAGVFFVQRDNTAAKADVANSETNMAFIDGQETGEVAMAARDIVTQIYTYDYNSIDGHSEGIRSLMTPGMYDEYQSMSPPNVEIIQQAKTTVVAVIDDLGVGVVALNGDNAVVDVVLGVQGDNDGADVSAATMPLRLKLERADGQWIASKIQPL